MANIGMVPLIFWYMTNMPHLPFSSNEPLQVNHCHMLTSPSTRNVFCPKSHPFDLQSDKMHHKSDIYGVVGRIFQF